MGENKKSYYSKASLEASKKYQKANYDRISLSVHKSVKSHWRDKATQLGYTSLNAFIKDAINEKIERG